MTYHYGGEEFTGAVRCSMDCPEMGEQLTIYVEEDNPERFVSSRGGSAAPWRGLLWGALIPAFVGTLCIIAGMLMSYMRRVAEPDHFFSIPQSSRPDPDQSAKKLATKRDMFAYIAGVAGALTLLGAILVNDPAAQLMGGVLALLLLAAAFLRGRFVSKRADAEKSPPL
ncbi:hypothetical protein [Natronosporangium hydrolyticum]|uniref:hypothetical protein n=1 Tax=Natronosporangium hydrolyticum TaxID=2811111 RepID=UPI003B84A4A0